MHQIYLMLNINRFLSQKTLLRMKEFHSIRKKTKARKQRFLVCSLLQEPIDSSVTFSFQLKDSPTNMENQNYREAKTLCRHLGKTECPKFLDLYRARNPSL